jgi:D-mannonate dehydratase
MLKPTRRNALLAAAAAPLAPAALATSPRQNRPGIKFTEIFGPDDRERWTIARQLGLNHAIVGVAGVLGKVRREDYASTLIDLHGKYKAAGLQIAGVESHPVHAEKIKLGVDGMEEELENYKWAISALKRAGIPMVCYNFMAGISWYRTNVKFPERGNALSSEFNAADAVKEGLTKYGEVSEEQMWKNMERFQKALIPVADKEGIQMAAHPDDPPLSPLRGIGRILVSAKNYERVMAMVPSKMNGVTFCQANFLAMGEDIYALARKWGNQKKIFFVHFRDIEGKRERFHETFHDNGPTDMAKMLKIYSETGFSGPLRPDHAPTMAGESNTNPGYAMNGKIYAFGYMKGIMDALGLPYE